MPSMKERKLLIFGVHMINGSLAGNVFLCSFFDLIRNYFRIGFVCSINSDFM